MGHAVKRVMSQKPATLNERLRLGVGAVWAGQHQAAREQFLTVLAEDDNNIAALLWLAFIAPSPQESLSLVQQVLVRQPDHERAQAGLRWAQKRLQARPGEATETGGSAALRYMSPGEIQSHPESLAKSARRTLTPLPAIILISAALGLVAIGAAAFLFFLPPETLAAWLPAPVRSSSSAAISPAVIEAAPAGRPGDKVESPVIDPLQPVAASEQIEPAVVDTAFLAEDTLAEGQVVAESALAEPPFLVGPLISADTAEPAPVDEAILAYKPAYPGEKWIEVNVTTQQVTAWEGNVPVMTFVASTGLPSTPTILGEYHIYWKLKSTLMVGPNYYLPDVPHTMYFYGSYALHGTYWHSNFGQPMSHGCVNLSNENAQKLFEWADPVIPAGQNQVTATADNPGTLVVVHQ